ncbi:MAG: polysaccharide biosynthesis tyrosine autokinase, partial [Chloroflexota bacterium]|nr:polysaccharide biosynthesis tyrosine autokinase [Chloroflexota bacterium]
DVAKTQAEIAALGDPESAPSEFARLERSRLESQLTRDQTRLVVLLSSAEEFRLAMARYTDTITIYAPAELPSKPVASRTLQNTLLGAVTGMMIGVGVAFLLEYLDDTIKTPQDVKQTLPVDVLGALPRLENHANGPVRLVVAEQPLHPIAEAFRNLRTSIEFSSLDRPARTLLVTSPLPTEGKTFTSANLAAIIAQGGKSVVLVDADLRHPRVHRACDLTKSPGLSDALLSPEERIAALRETAVAGLRIVTAGSQAPNPAEMLASERMETFIVWLKEQADVVILDSPPILAVTDAAVLSTRVDGTLLVIDSGETRRPAAVQAFERLTSVGSRVLGVVLNRLSASEDGYYYYYSYYSEDSARGDHRPWITRLLKLSWSKRDKETSGGETEEQR